MLPLSICLSVSLYSQLSFCIYTYPHTHTCKHVRVHAHADICKDRQTVTHFVLDVISNFFFPHACCNRKTEMDITSIHWSNGHTFYPTTILFFFGFVLFFVSNNKSAMGMWLSGYSIRLVRRRRRFDSLVWQGIFLLELSFSANPLTVSVDLPCAIACINICAHVKVPVVHVRVWWIMETLTNLACS